MNPGHAKAFLGSMAQAIQIYESQYGEIQVPKQVPEATVQS